MSQVRLIDYSFDSLFYVWLFEFSASSSIEVNILNILMKEGHVCSQWLALCSLQKFCRENSSSWIWLADGFWFDGGEVFLLNRGLHGLLQDVPSL